jgi:hypothetical protein
LVFAEFLQPNSAIKNSHGTLSMKAKTKIDAMSMSNAMDKEHAPNGDTVVELQDL